MGFLRDELWDAEIEPRSWAARGVGFLQFAAMVAEGFVRDHLMLRASALTYFTVLSLIPLVAIAIAIGGAVGMTANLAELVVERIAAGSPESQQRILEIIERVEFGKLGGIGGAVLFVTTVLGISNIEQSFNHIWGVKRPRSLGRRFTDYLAVLVIAPILLGSALSLKTTLESQWLVQRLIELPLFALFYDLGLSQLPTVVLAVAFAFLYWFLPNTTVRASAAFLGGLVAGVLVEISQTVYIDFSVGAARANMFFGGFAQLPLLLVWIFVFWAIVLFGAEVAFAYQNLALYRREVRGGRAGPGAREAIGLRIAVEVARAFRDAAPAWTDDGLSDALRIPVRTVREVLARLDEAGVVAARSAPDQPEGFQLGRPAESIRVSDVLFALRGAREPVAGDSGVGALVEGVFAELEEGAAKGPAGVTLAELLSGISPLEPKSRA
jgi:membrane protein